MRLSLKTTLSIGILVLILLGYFIVQWQRTLYFRRELLAIETVGDQNVKYYNARRYLRAREFLTRNKKQFDHRKGRHYEPSTRRVSLAPFEEKPFLKAIANPPKWMLDQIEREFSPYSDFSQTASEIEKLGEEFPQCHSITKYKICKGKLYFISSEHPDRRMNSVSAAIDHILQIAPLPDMEFFISSEDAFSGAHVSFPVLTFSKKKEWHFSITIPDYEMLAGYDHLNLRLDRAHFRFPWKKKKEIAFWRGGTTGGDFSTSTWRELPRAQLVLLGKEKPRALDARFHVLVQGAETNPEILSDPDLVGRAISPQESLQYKYLIDIDGNASGYSRYYWILRSDSAAFKHETPFIQWYYSALQPYIHYIPIKRDLSDLLENIAWARNHDEEVKRIAKEGACFAKKYLTQEVASAYLYLVLRKYGELYSRSSK